MVGTERAKAQRALRGGGAPRGPYRKRVREREALVRGAENVLRCTVHPDKMSALGWLHATE